LASREVVVRGQAPPPAWHAGRQHEERPPRHPDSPAKSKTRGSESKKKQLASASPRSVLSIRRTSDGGPRKCKSKPTSIVAT
jgi:hypothetical protein